MEGSELPQRTSTRAYLWATLVLVVLLGFSLLLYFLGGNAPVIKNTDSAINAPTNGHAAVTRAVPPVAVEPNVILAREGTVTQVSSSSVRFSSPVFNEKKGGYESKELTAKITGETTFLEVDRSVLPVPPVPGQTTGTTPESKSISRQELKVGDIIEVEADSNMKGLTTFSAKKIQRILTQ